MSIDTTVDELPKEVQFDEEKDLDWYCNLVEV